MNKLSKLDDLSLITQVLLLKNTRAFDKLVQKYQSDLRRFFLNHTRGDKMLSDDLAQETFLKAYMYLKTFNRRASFSTWLHSIAYNTLCDWWRSHRDPEQQIDSVKELQTTNTNQTNLTTDLYSALDILSDQERTCVTLFYMEDISINDISKITGMPVGTIKSHLSRGRSKLSEFLKQNGYE